MRHSFLALVCLLSIFLSGCLQPLPSQTNRESFREFTDSLFRQWVVSDSLTLNYTLKNPDQYNITQLPKGFFSSGQTTISNSCESENLLQRMETYHRDSLPRQEQILYDTLKDYMTQNQKELSFEEYSNVLDPTSGIQAQLPVLLAEFHWDSKEDVSQYFLLLESIPSYFEELLQIQKNKKQAGTLPSRKTLLTVIDQCEDFVSEKGYQMIQTCFQKKISSLFPNDASKLIKRHNDYLTQYVVPAYQNLATGLTPLLPDAPEDGSLSVYPNGCDYYSFLFQKKSGSSKPISYWKTVLSQRLKQSETELLRCASKDPAAFRTCQDYEKNFSSPDDILKTLQDKMKRDFPTSSNTTYQLHTVDDALEDYLSPAFYLTPPIDDKTHNAIYINESPKYRHSSLFNTLAHEGYPGHLYQNCYLREKKLPLLRYLMEYPGYTEGYATYAEIYSYRYTGGSPNEIAILQNNAIATHCIYALCDIGIHQDHWSLSRLSSFLGQHGYGGEENATRIYQAIIDSPGCYLPYTIGYLQFESLRKQFSSDLAYHTFILDTGPTSFDLLKKYAASARITS